MKLLQSLLTAMTLILAALLVATGQFYAAAVSTFVGLAAATPWSAHPAGVFSSNVIADELKLTKVLEYTILGLRAALAPLRLFSTAVNRNPMGAGNDDDNSVTVPVYGFTSGDAQDRTPGQAYSSKVSNTQTGARKILINKEKVIGLGFTNEEAQNQVSFDPELHGLIKGHDLARTVLQDIFGVVRYGKFPNATLAPLAASAFDHNDVAELAQKCMEADWPQLPRPGLALNPAYHFALLKQPALLDASQSGSTDALRNARVNDIMGFSEVGSNGIPLNNGSAQSFTAVAATDLCTATGHGLLTGDQVVCTTTTTLPAGLATGTYYYVIKVSDNTFKLASSLANANAGTAVDITDTGTGTHSIALRTNLVGVAGAPSAIITGFRPVIPTQGIRQKLVNFELVDDPESGLTLEFRHIADEDTGKEYQVIGVHYGYEFGLAEAMKLISSPAA